MQSTAKLLPQLNLTPDSKWVQLSPPEDVSSSGFEQTVAAAEASVLQMSRYWADALHIKYTPEEIECGKQGDIIMRMLRKFNLSAQQLRNYVIENKLQKIVNGQSRVYCPEYNNTWLHLEIANEKTDKVSLFLNALHEFINPNLKDSQGKTILVLAAKMRNECIVDQILATKFAEKLEVNASDKEGRTALHYACALGNVDLVLKLILHGADITIKDNDGNTPFMMTEIPIEEIISIMRSVSMDNTNYFFLVNRASYIYARGSADEKHNYVVECNKYFSQPLLQRYSNYPFVQQCLKGKAEVKSFIVMNYSSAMDMHYKKIIKEPELEVVASNMLKKMS